MIDPRVAKERISAPPVVNYREHDLAHYIINFTSLHVITTQFERLNVCRHQERDTGKNYAHSRHTGAFRCAYLVHVLTRDLYSTLPTLFYLYYIVVDHIVHASVVAVLVYPF